MSAFFFREDRVQKDWGEGKWCGNGIIKIAQDFEVILQKLTKVKLFKYSHLSEGRSDACLVPPVILLTFQMFVVTPFWDTRKDTTSDTNAYKF